MERSARRIHRESRRFLNILQVSTMDRGGGAEKVAWDLFDAYRGLGHNSWLAVRTKKTENRDVISLAGDRHRSAWARFWMSVSQGRQSPVLRDRLEWIAEPLRKLKRRQGLEDFEFPDTRRLLDLAPQRPDVIHCHNLHEGYFDLRALAVLSYQVPVILTLHDEWLLTGHCAYTLGCDRWRIGCGSCPDLQIYPAIGRDATAYNWRRKRNIFARSRVHVSTPCRWLSEKIEQSMLGSAMVEKRVIPYGIDLHIFHPADKRITREQLGIPVDAKVLLFTANGVRRNPFKDFTTIESAVREVSEGFNSKQIIFIALGEDSADERRGRCETRFVPYQTDPSVVAQYYQAADVYLHAAKTDTFPNAILEALGCGTPVIATAVGGIPEQVKGFADYGGKWNQFRANEATGILVPSKDGSAMAAATALLLTDENLHCKLSINAAQDARQRFDLGCEVREYLNWYKNLVEATRES